MFSILRGFREQRSWTQKCTSSICKAEHVYLQIVVQLIRKYLSNKQVEGKRDRGQRYLYVCSRGYYNCLGREQKQRKHIEVWETSFGKEKLAYIALRRFFIRISCFRPCEKRSSDVFTWKRCRQTARNINYLVSWFRRAETNMSCILSLGFAEIQHIRPEQQQFQPTQEQNFINSRRIILRGRQRAYFIHPPTHQLQTSSYHPGIQKEQSRTHFNYLYML